MKEYLLIASRDPFENRSVDDLCDLAAGLAKRGENVTVFLVENGAAASRRNAKSTALEALAKKGVAILADTFSLRERGIAENELKPSIRPASLEAVIDGLDAGAIAIWH